MAFDQPSGATPLSDDDLKGLRVPARTQEELNRFEAAAIEQARLRFERSNRLRKDFPTDAELRWLHREMLQEVWRWAGLYRTSDTNIGVDFRLIPVRMRDLCTDVAAQLITAMDRDEICAQFHHRLVAIPPAPATVDADALPSNLRWLTTCP